MLDSFILLRRIPPSRLRGTIRVFVADGMAPCEVVIDLQKVVVSEDRGVRLHSAEKIHHPLFEFRFETGNVARGVDFRKGHAEFVRQAPEAGEQDGTGEEVVLAVGAFVHDGEVVLD